MDPEAVENADPQLKRKTGSSTLTAMKISEVVQSPGFESALARSVKALRRFAGYEIEPAIQERMRDLGERKEFLSEAEHAELLSLIEFCEHRTIERLEAEAALSQLRQFVPELVETP